MNDFGFIHPHANGGPPRLGGALAAGAGIYAVFGVANVTAGAGAFVGKAPRQQLLERRKVAIRAATLVFDRSIPSQPEKLERAQDVIRTAAYDARRVYVFDA